MNPGDPDDKKKPSERRIETETARALESPAAGAHERALESDTDHILGMAAHELKNALGPLAMTLQICERHAAAGQPVARDDLAFARAQVRKVSQLVNDLLDASRIDSGQFPLRLAHLDLCALVQSTVDAFRRANPRRIVCDVPPLPLVHVADGERLATVLTNFLDNAAKYAPEPSPIEVRMSQAAERVRIAVTDHGPGIRAEDQTRIFQRYFRARDTADAVSGLGLGLYLCRAIAERHGGAVGVDSAPGRGATFWLDLTLGQS
jgi:signal transduction histidine kinase